MAAAVCAAAGAGSGAKALALLLIFNEGVDNGSDNGNENKTNQNISQHGKRSFLRMGKQYDRGNYIFTLSLVASL